MTWEWAFLWFPWIPWTHYNYIFSRSVVISFLKYQNYLFKENILKEIKFILNTFICVKLSFILHYKIKFKSITVFIKILMKLILLFLLIICIYSKNCNNPLLKPAYGPLSTPTRPPKNLTVCKGLRLRDVCCNMNMVEKVYKDMKAEF